MYTQVHNHTNTFIKNDTSNTILSLKGSDLYYFIQENHMLAKCDNRQTFDLVSSDYKAYLNDRNKKTNDCYRNDWEPFNVII